MRCPKQKLQGLRCSMQGLSNCSNTLIGIPSAGAKGISSGEKRRASVAIELVTSPVCVFLDEPTSGLDSEIALSVMRTLKRIALAGRTIVLTVHQPNSDITSTFDDFIMMAQGRIMYTGVQLPCPVHVCCRCVCA